jgi:beta-galactosidase
VDNSINPDIIPSQKSDFFIYGGLCRNVWLKEVPSTYISSIRISTGNVRRESASTTLRVDVTRAPENAGTFTLDAELLDGKGHAVSRRSLEHRIDPGVSTLVLEMPAVAKPDLWSPAHPALYTARVVLRGEGERSDTLSDRFGYRWFEFREHGPFFLNGERLLLRGTQRHEEYAGMGNALPDSLQRRDVLMAREMGANFLRLAHYPQAPEVYRACDELGILVWDELPWCRGGVGGAVWKENTRRMLGEMIRQNFNHPSIIMWSLGNEIYWVPDVPGGDNNDSLRSFLTLLNSDAHALDPGRVTTMRKYYEGADITDVFSPSIWSGWYSGSYFNYEKAITDASKKYPRLFHAEYGGDSHVGRHSENPITGDGMLPGDGWDPAAVPVKIKNVSLSGDWSESYMVNLIDWHLSVSEKLDWFAGSAQWILKDFGTPLRPENPIPYVNQKGILDRAGNPKDIYFVYKSRWTVDPKFCAIESHTWTERSGPEHLKRTVKVYSNCQEVELLIGGVGEGRRRRDCDIFPACGLLWDVEFKEGPNVIVAVGYEGGRAVAADTVVVQYRYRKNEEADHIELSAVRRENGHVLVTALAVDRNGQRCLDYNKRIYFAKEGAGTLLENLGTPTGSTVIEMANGMANIEFVPEQTGTAIIEARNQDFKGSTVYIVNGSPR